MGNRVGSNRGQAYVGVGASQPPNTIFADRDPTQFDSQNVSVSDIWINTISLKSWELLSLAGNQTSKGQLAHWYRLTNNSGGPGIETLTTQDDTVVAPNAVGNVNIVGTDGIITEGNADSNTVIVTVDGSLAKTFTTDDAVIVLPIDNNINVHGTHGLNTIGNVVTGTVTTQINNDITLGDLEDISGNAALTLQSGFLNVVNDNVLIGNTNDNGNPSLLEFLKNRDGGAIISGDILGNITFLGNDGADYVASSAIVSQSVGIIAPDEVGSNLQFFTHPESIVAITQRMVIDSDGSVVINAPDVGGADALTVIGNIDIPNTNAIATEGIIKYGGNNFITNYGTNNTFVGQATGNVTLTTASAINNSIFGAQAGSDLTTGPRNTGIGAFTLADLTEGTDNSGMGYASLTNLITGSNNIAVGSTAGTNYTSTESSNILIGNDGVVTESNTIRIGGGTGDGVAEQNRAFLSGVNGVTVANQTFVTIDTVTDQLGTANVSTGSVITTAFTASGTWTINPDTVWVEVFGWGGGGGGASGNSNATNGGGGGGGSGGFFFQSSGAQFFNPVGETVTIGAGAFGGAGSSGANGNAGGPPTSSSIGKIQTGNGVSAGRGTATGAGVGGIGGQGWIMGSVIVGASGGAGNVGTGVGFPGISSSGIGACTGGGGGGAGSAAGGAGGAILNAGLGTLSAGGAGSFLAGGPGNAGLQTTDNYIIGGTGGGGGGSTGGGAGAIPGGGGGGTSGQVSGTTGTGGAGARGEIWIVEYL